MRGPSFSFILCPAINRWTEDRALLPSAGYPQLLAPTHPHALGGLSAVHTSARHPPRRGWRKREEGEGCLPSAFLMFLLLFLIIPCCQRVNYKVNFQQQSLQFLVFVFLGYIYQQVQYLTVVWFLQVCTCGSLLLFLLKRKVSFSQLSIRQSITVDLDGSFFPGRSCLPPILGRMEGPH